MTTKLIKSVERPGRKYSYKHIYRTDSFNISFTYFSVPNMQNEIHIDIFYFRFIYSQLPF
jgi:hypothetical protein